MERRASRESLVVLAVAAGVAAALLYAGQFVISRWSFQRTLTPWDLAAVRFIVAGLLLLPIVLHQGVRDAAGIGWRRAMVLATLAGAPYTLVMFTGLTLAPAAHGAVIITGGTPVVSSALAWIWLGARPSPARLVGIALVIAGLLLVSGSGLADTGGARVWLGDLTFVIPTVMWGCFTVLTRQWHIEPVRGTAVVWVLALVYVPVYLLVFGSRALEAPVRELVIQGMYQGVGVAIGALMLYAFAIRILGASLASLFMPLVPVFGMLLAIPVLGEIPSAVQIAGLVGVSVGMAIASRHGDVP
jgi:drug/metabolite transporter (DMT)-like permease